LKRTQGRSGEKPPRPVDGPLNRSRDDNPLGRASKFVRQKIVSPPSFDHFILLVIGINCVFLAWNDPDRFLAAEYVCTIIFMIEMVLKFLAWGFWGTYNTEDDYNHYVGYFNSGWNIVDFIIVASSITIFFGSSGSGALRALRIFRPLRALSMTAGAIVGGLQNALEGLFDVVLLLSFLKVCFAIFAVQLFAGSLHRRCFDASVSPLLSWRDWDDDLYGGLTNDQFCRKVTSSECIVIPNANGGFDFSDHDNCPSPSCPVEYPLCLEIAPNPNAEVNSWDNFHMAMLNIFWVISLEQWVNSMYMLQDAYHPQVWIFFYVVTALVSFFALNLCLAVIEEALEEAGYNALIKHDVSEKTKQKLKRAVTRIRHEDTEDESDSESWDQALFESIYPEAINAKKQLRHTRQLRKSGKKKGEVASPGHEDLEKALSQSDNLTVQEIMGTKGKQSAGARYRIKVSAEDYLKKLANERKNAVCIAKSAWRHSIIHPNEYLKGKRGFIIYMNKFVESASFNSFVMLCIVANTIVLALVWPNQSEELQDILEIMNGAFTWFFFMEMILKIIGLGPHYYWSDSWNRFDALIVVVSVLEFFIVFATGGGGGVFSGLRALRVLRAFRVIRNEKLRTILNSVIESMVPLFYLVVIFAVFLFILCVLGQSLFGEKWKNLEEPDDIHTFDGFFESFLLVFQVITGDNWNGVMVEAVSITSMSATIYFIACICFGSFVLLNLFIAILLSQLEDQSPDRWTREDAARLATKLRQDDIKEPKTEDHWIRIITSAVLHRQHKREFSKKFASWKAASYSKSKMLGKSFWYFRSTHPVRIWMHRIAMTKSFTAGIDFLIVIACILLAIETPKTSERVKRNLRICDYVFTSVFVIEMIVKMIAKGVTPSRVFYDYDWKEVYLDPLPLGELEKKCGKAVHDMHLQDPEITFYAIQPDVIYKVVDSHDGWRVVLFSKSMDMRLLFFEGKFHTAFMSTMVEGKHKWIQWGKQQGTEELRFGKRIYRMDVRTICESVNCDGINHNSYFSSNWNKLDFAVVAFSVFGLAFESLAIFRVLRAIRPLRVAIRIQQVKIVLTALVRAVPSMGATFVFVGLIWFVVAILGTYFLSGAMYSCGCAKETLSCADYISSFSTLAECSGHDDLFTWQNGQCACLQSELDCETMLGDVLTKDDCLAHPDAMEWTNSLWNFDHVFQSIHTLFVMATLSGWAGTMYEGINVVGVDKQPQEWHNKYLGIYFVIAIVICSFFSLNLIVSVVIDNFNRIKAEKNGSAFLTEKQQQWVKTQRLSSRIGLSMEIVPPPENTIYMSVYKIVQNRYFEPFILSCILLNVGFMCTVHYDMSKGYEEFLYISDIIFIIIFTLEALFKMLAYGNRVYFNDNWNKFDFFIVVCGIISLMEFVQVGLNVIRLFRFFRIGRALRLVNNVQKLKTLFLTLVYSTPSLWNIGALIFVIMFIYAVIGVATFGEDLCEGACAEENEDIVTKVNFTSFFPALNLLYRVSTEDGWTDLYGTFVELHDPSWEVYVYFTTFFIFGTLVLWNLFIAVILDVFDDNKEMISVENQIECMFSWRDEWKKFDTMATGTITAEEFVHTILNADSPAGFDGKKVGKNLDEQELMKFLHDLRLVTRDNELFEDSDLVDQFADWVRFFCTWSEDERLVGYVVDYGDAVIALTNKILEDIRRKNDVSNVPIDVDLKDGEKFIADWYCEENPALKQLLTDVQLKSTMENQSEIEMTDQTTTELSDSESFINGGASFGHRIVPAGDSSRDGDTPNQGPNSSRDPNAKRNAKDEPDVSSSPPSHHKRRPTPEFPPTHVNSFDDNNTTAYTSTPTNPKQTLPFYDSDLLNDDICE